nr:MAG TPA: hypothetical protein [Caudoviricetes sp.]
MLSYRCLFCNSLCFHKARTISSPIIGVGHSWVYYILFS